MTTLGLVPEALSERRQSGPAPAASRDQVLAIAREHFLGCRRVDVKGIAAESGVGRATMYRWFGSREGLLAEAMLGVFAERVAGAQSAVAGEGAEAVQETISRIYAGLAEAPHIQFLISTERATALTLMTSSDGPVHPRIVELIQGLIEGERARGDYEPPSDPATLAYVLVRLAEAMLFNYASDEAARDLAKLREVMAPLLGATKR